mgnify:CR=1 FL=1
MAEPSFKELYYSEPVYQKEVEADTLGFKLYQKALQGKNPYLSQQSPIVQRYFNYYQSKDETARLKSLESARQQDLQQNLQRQQDIINQQTISNQLKNTRFKESEKSTISNIKLSYIKQQGGFLEDKRLNLGSYNENIKKGSGKFTGAVDIGNNQMQDYVIEYDKGKVTNFNPIGQKQQKGSINPIISYKDMDIVAESNRFYDLLDKGEIQGFSTRILTDKQKAKSDLLSSVKSYDTKQSSQVQQFGTYYEGRTPEGKQVLMNLTPEKQFKDYIAEPYFQTEFYKAKSTGTKDFIDKNFEYSEIKDNDFFFPNIKTMLNEQKIRPLRIPYYIGDIESYAFLKLKNQQIKLDLLSSGQASSLAYKKLINRSKTMKYPKISSRLYEPFQDSVSAGLLAEPLSRSTVDSVKFLVEKGVISPVAESTIRSISRPVKDTVKISFVESNAYTRIGSTVDDTLDVPILNLPKEFKGGGTGNLGFRPVTIYDVDVAGRSAEVVKEKKKTSFGKGIQQQTSIDTKNNEQIISLLKSESKQLKKQRVEFTELLDKNIIGYEKGSKYLKTTSFDSAEDIVRIKTKIGQIIKTTKKPNTVSLSTGDLKVTKLFDVDALYDPTTDFLSPSGTLYKVSGQVKQNKGVVSNIDALFLKSTEGVTFKSTTKIINAYKNDIPIGKSYIDDLMKSSNPQIQSLLKKEGTEVSQKLASQIVREVRLSVPTITIPRSNTVLSNAVIPKLNIRTSPVSSNQLDMPTSQVYSRSFQDLGVMNRFDTKIDTKTDNLFKDDILVDISSRTRQKQLEELKQDLNQRTKQKQESVLTERVVQDNMQKLIQEPVLRFRQPLKTIQRQRLITELRTARVRIPLLDTPFVPRVPLPKFPNLRFNTGFNIRGKRTKKRRTDNLIISEGFTEKLLKFTRKINRKNVYKEAMSEGNLLKIRGRPILN